MSDDRNKHGGHDRSRVASNQDWDVNYMTQKFKVTLKEVQEAVQAVGNDRQKVEEYLQWKNVNGE